MSQFEVVLNPVLDAFVKREIESGRYADANEVVSAALEMLEREDLKAAALERAVMEGEMSGVAEGDVFAQVRERAGLPPRLRN